MCTVTLIPVARDADSDAWTHLRLACNRDELRIRPAAMPPEIRRRGSRTAIMPIDPLSDGSWIAVNDAGLAATLLNVNPPAPPGLMQSTLRNSRGILAPRLMACSTLDEAERHTADIDPDAFPPFRLVVVDRNGLIDCRGDGSSLRRQRLALSSHPLLFTSSGLGDHLVEQPRRALFESMFTHEADWPAAQVAFHRHAWPDRRHVSVCMERDEARTVSHTIIDLERGRATLTYYGDAPDRATSPVALSLSIREAAA
ncbi:MAG: NRDE family protein [Phycisphaerae bacterium]|nr:NRDE family protein [Phycisphaerae bacterium]NUQ46502.1 NRDE family protein [Phycisphaerae bacterium]